MPKQFTQEDWKNYINRRFQKMSSLKSTLEGEWDAAYRKYVGSMDGRFSDRNEELNEVDLNLSREKSDLIIRYVTKLLLRDNRFINLSPRGPDDIEADKIMSDTVKYYISMFPNWRELGFKWLSQAVVKGFSPAKIVPLIKGGKLKQLKFLPININKLFLDPTWCTGIVRDMFLELEYTEQELLDLPSNVYNRKAIKEMIGGGDGIAVEDNDTLDIFGNTKTQNQDVNFEPIKKKNIKKEENKYVIREYWYLSKDKNGDEVWLLEVWGCDGDNMEYLIREEKEPLYWMGHPFCFAVHNPHLYDLYGTGEPVIATPYQDAINRALNQSLDYNDMACNPTLMVARDAITDISDLDAVKNPRLGGIAIVDKLGPGYIDYFKIPPLSNSTSYILSYLDEADERMSIRSRYLSGAGPEAGEPLGTTQINRANSLESIDHKTWVINWGLETLVEKVLICIQQYKPIDDIVRVTGKRGYRFLRLGEPRQSLNDQLVTRDPNNAEITTLNLTAGKKEALKSYDIIINSADVDSPEVIVDRLMKILQFTAGNPAINQTELLREVLDKSGFKNTDDILPQEGMLNPVVSKLLAKIPPQQLMQILQQAGVIPSDQQIQQQGGGQEGSRVQTQQQAQ